MKDQAFPSDRAETGRRSGRAAASDGGVIDFASWVVALLAARKQSAEPRLRPSVLAAFRVALVDEDPTRLDLFLRDLVRQKVSASAVADLYIPAMARTLGEDWLEDRATFLDVTLAASRMQAMLRAIGMAWTADNGSAPNTCSLLLVVPQHEQHSLGAMVLLGQLRRIGISVRLLIAPSEKELRSVLSAVSFSGVLISVAGTERLAEIPQLVAQVRAVRRVGLPIVVGGQVVRCDKDVLASTGADAVARNLSEALCACGIELDHNSTLRRA
jgi:MerR family transcriptional regulator, light-induced transcriptional regulator